MNNILGGIIGATKSTYGIWSLSNGIILNRIVMDESMAKKIYKEILI